MCDLIFVCFENCKEHIYIYIHLLIISKSGLILEQYFINVVTFERLALELRDTEFENLIKYVKKYLSKVKVI